MYSYVYVCMIIVYMYVYTRGCMHVWPAYMGTCVSLLGVCIDPPSSLCVWWRVAAFQTRSCDPNSVTGDSDLYPFWTRCTGDSKTDPWDDP